VRGAPHSAASSIHVIASAVGADELDFAGHTSPDGAITLLFSDVADAPALAARLGEARAARLFRDHQTLVQELVVLHGGSVVKAQDDGLMASFPSAHAGLRCAIAMQRTFFRQPIPELGRPLELRIGLHTGFLIADANEFYGRNVLLAARIADRARPGEVLVSAVVREYTETDSTFAFEDRGEFRLRGLLGEHAVHAVHWRPVDA
jgi:class 3 adenylate cyclase